MVLGLLCAWSFVGRGSAREDVRGGPCPLAVWGDGTEALGGCRELGWATGLPEVGTTGQTLERCMAM